MEIGLFQLENLCLTQAKFLLLDLRTMPQAEAALDRWLSRATHMAPMRVEKHLKEQKIALDFPIILLCERGATSTDLAHRLEAAGYSNIYVVARGVVGLLSEL